ncbi:hypothetical protein AAF712_012635 [Marasmius tenuissimus]|uniref:GST N-terminal domain-containing protein n=1 Tax=Marasmius tenuissimus TaxID=585030 RepID=A0ABR2ZH51_9AGAR
MLTLYDLGPTTFPEFLGGASHVRKIIFALNYKKLPFKIEVLPFGSLEPTARSLGASPTGTHPDGTPKYTVPFLYDSDKSKIVTESFAIAEYLDETYPDTPKLFAEGTTKAQRELIDAREAATGILVPITFPKASTLWSEEMVAFIRNRGTPLEVTLSSEDQEALWVKAKKAFEEAEKQHGEGSDKNEYVFADFALAGPAWTFRVSFGEESNEWREMKSWAGGKMGKVTDAAVEYTSQLLST